MLAPKETVQMIRFLAAAVILAAFTAQTYCASKGPAFTPAGGFYNGAVQVSIETKNLDVFITTDGSVPSPRNGQAYVRPLVITNTTILRAAAFRGGEIIGTSSTCTYLFPSDIIHQDGAGFPSTWGTNKGAAVPAYYQMTPEIVSAPEYRGLIERSLKDIPSISLVLAPEDLFGALRGIYAHPEETGAEWERPASFEFISGNTNLQLNCGVRIQGGWNRRPEESPKHAFRLVFKKKYGPRKLHYALFGKDAPEEFDSLILRAGCNNSWLHWSGVERRRAEFMRDQWMRDTFRAMGHPSAAGKFVHLYLNGLYWGLYNLTERPDADFAAAHLGGSGKDYDSFNADKTVEGDRFAWTELMRRINRGVKTSTDLSSVEELLDLENFIDYMILNFYGANADWDRSSNWYAARRRNPPGKFNFFVWDAERTLEQVTDCTIDFDDDESPPRIFHRLAGNEEFRRLFSKRVERHLFGDGVLTPQAAGGRFRALSEQLDLAIVAESARWGDYRRAIHQYKEGPYELYTRNQHWRPEVNRLLTEHFPRRTAVVLEHFGLRGLAKTRTGRTP
jgi:hypothetical protein